MTERLEARYAAAMTQRAATITRRRAMGLLALAPVPLCLPPVLRPVGAVSDDPEARLRRALAAMRLPFPADLDLIGFSSDPSHGRFRMAAVVRMTWAPGMRQRPFSAEADDPEEGLAALLGDIRSRFSAAV